MMKRVFFILMISLLFLPGAGSVPNATDPKVVHRKALTIDTHTDTPLAFIHFGLDMGVRNDARVTQTKVDFPRMKEGGLDAVFFAVYIGQGKRDSASVLLARRQADLIFDEIYKTVHRNDAIAGLAYEARDAYRIEKEDKRAVFIGMENGYPLGTDLLLVEEYYDKGARYITLCHSRNNDICDSSTDPSGAEHEGLSAFGVQLVREMNRLGMIVDVSHISDNSFYDVLETSAAPVMASHSCARALCNNPRNLDDDMLRALARNGGVIQVCFVSSYLKEQEPDAERDSAMNALMEKYRNFDELDNEQRNKAMQEWMAMDEKYPEPLASVSDVVDHIDHIVRVAGIDHVGIGTDFDGGGAVNGCFDVSEMENITVELVKRGYTSTEIRKIWGGNLMRVFREVENMARTIQRHSGE